MEKSKKPNNEEKELTMQQIFESVMGAEEILERKVVKLGNSGHIAIPAKHIGKTARVSILKNKEVEDHKKEEDKHEKK